MENSLTLTADDNHSFGAYRADPKGKAKGGIIVIQEIFGVNKHIRQVCDGFATDGYVAIAPALFDRSDLKNCQLGYTPNDIASGREIMQAFSWDLCMKDIKAVVELMKNRARSLIYTTGLPPAILAGAIAAVDIIRTDKKRVAKPYNLAKSFCADLGLGEPESPIVPIILGDDTATMNASFELEKAGYLVTPIRPPTVPQGTSRLRITFTAEHTKGQVEGLMDAISPLIDGKILRRNTSEV